MKKKTIKLKRFGKITEEVTSDFKKWVWFCKFGNSEDNPKDSSLIMKFVFDQKDYPNKKDIPLYKEIALEVIK